jgi:hypothetical protein
VVLFSLRLGTSGNLCCSAYDFSVWLLCVAGVLCMVWRAAGGLVGGVRPAFVARVQDVRDPLFPLLFCSAFRADLFVVGGGVWCGPVSGWLLVWCVVLSRVSVCLCVVSLCVV